MFKFNISLTKTGVMSVVRFSVKSKQKNGISLSNLYSPICVRYINGRKIDRKCVIPLSVLPKDWNANKEVVKNTLTSVKVYEDINLKLENLKTEILNKANQIIMEGKEIDSAFLKNTVNIFFNRDIVPVKNTTINDFGEEVDVQDNSGKHIYLTKYMQWWIDNRQEGYLTRNNKPLAQSSKLQQQWAVNLLIKFEADKKIKIKFSKLSDDLQNKLIKYILSEKGKTQSSLNTFITFAKFFIKSAIKDKVQIHEDYPNRAFFVKRSKERIEKAQIFNFKEIEIIYRHDFSNNPKLDALRDYFIIGLCTGMRVSDFYITLEDKHIHRGKITKNAIKNDVLFKVPVLYMIDEILEKWGGLPPREVEKNWGNMRHNFNTGIRDICQEIGFNEIVIAKHWDKELDKMVHGKCEKWQAVSSHICRKSCATNLDKAGVRGEDIDAMMGWLTPTMRLQYTQTSLDERADRALDVINIHMQQKTA